MTTRRRLLTICAVIGLVGPNGVFIYYLLFRFSELVAAFQHPVLLAYVAESFLVMGLLAGAIARKPASRLGWKAFIACSLIGGLGFSVPLALLLNDEKND